MHNLIRVQFGTERASAVVVFPPSRPIAHVRSTVSGRVGLLDF